LLLTLLHEFTHAYRTEHIPKYSSIEKTIKLPFQRVLIRLNQSPDEGAMAVSLHTACCPEFQHVQPSLIRPYPLVGTSNCLAAWFIGT
jgi:hypothetical protein